MSSTMQRWVCEDPSCNHSLYASHQPDPTKFNWSDGHVCSFIPVPHIEEQPIYEMNGVEVYGGGIFDNGLKEIIDANYIHGGFLDYSRLRAVVMLNKGDEVTFTSGKHTTTIRRIK